MFRLPIAIAILVAFTPLPAHAQADAVQLTSVVEVERQETAADGAVRTVRKTPDSDKIVPGDRLVVTLTYRNGGTTPATGFVAVNPLPGPVAFDSVTESWADVSVDGGKSFGKLAALTVSETAADGSAATRPAQPVDVTHIRWALPQAVAPGASGTLSYRGTVK